MAKHKLLLSILFIFELTQLAAQQEYNEYFDINTYWLGVDPVYKIENPLIQEIKIEYKRPKSKKPSTSISRYDEKGRLVELLHLTKKGLAQPAVKKTYNVNGKVMSITRFKNGKLRSNTVFTRLPKGDYLSVEKTNKNGKIIEKSTWSYNEDGNLSGSVRYKKGGTATKNKWVYEYYAKNKKSKTTLYRGDSKVKKVWSFDCKEEGEQLVKKKNETQVCMWEQSSADYLTKVYQTFDQKGKMVKYVTKFTIRDTLPIEQSMYDDNDKLRLKDTYDKSFKRQLKREFYKKGNLRSEAVWTYNDSLQTSYYWLKKGTVQVKHDFNYNEKNLLNQEKWFNKGKLQTTISLSYTYWK